VRKAVIPIWKKKSKQQTIHLMQKCRSEENKKKWELNIPSIAMKMKKLRKKE
jgi:hypothetical protein